MQRGQLAAMALAVAAFAPAVGLLAADDTVADERTAEEKLEELEQKVKVLERKAEIAEEQAAEKAKSGVTTTASARDGFSIKSANGAFVLRVRGYVQGDGRFFNNQGERLAPDTFVLRRVRPIFEGTVGARTDYRVMLDFGSGTSTVQDAYLDVKAARFLKVRLGKFKPPVGLERLQSGQDLLFVERALPTNLVPNRDIGIQLHGTLGRGFEWQLAGLNGVADGASSDGDNNDQKDVVGRAFWRPWKDTPSLLSGLGFGLAASEGKHSGTVLTTGLPVYRSPALQAIFLYRSDGTVPGTVLASGSHGRLAPQAYFYRGRFGTLFEWVQSKQEVSIGGTVADLTHEAWQVAASFALTRDEPTYRAITPKRPLNAKEHHWGAWELKMRYAELDLDDDAFPVYANPDIAVSAAHTASAGVTWYLDRHVKFYLDLETTRFDGGDASGDRPDEDALFLRAQVAF